MITIQIKFLTGRWHATPWGRQVNEGAVEWPPAPWRILRALIAVWHHKCSDIPEEQIAELITKLTALPVYNLPSASQGHTRHYMPIAGEKPKKIFDTFITISRDAPVTICWQEATLNDEQQAILSRLLKNLSYFGRAESWVEATLLEDWKGEINVAVADEGTDHSGKIERVRLLATVPETEYTAWQEETVKQLLESGLQKEQQKAIEKKKDPAKAKLSQKKQIEIKKEIPETLFLALHAETNDLRKSGWNRPPGSRWVDYCRPKSAFDTLPKERTQAMPTESPTVARYAIASNVQPLFTDAIRIGERVRQVLMGCSKKTEPTESCAFVFSGKHEDGSSSEKQHQHAHFLVEACDNKEPNRISHISIFASGGFNTSEEQAALERLKKVWGDGGHALQLVLLGVGNPEDFGGTNTKVGQSPIFAKSKVWVSKTPFVSPRHLHIRGRDKTDITTRHKAVLRELTSIIKKEFQNRPWLQQHLTLLESIDFLEGEEKDKKNHWLKFRRDRKKGGGKKANTQGYGFRLTFSEPIQGPILLGYSSHFGLGQFVPAE